MEVVGGLGVLVGFALRLQTLWAWIMGHIIFHPMFFFNLHLVSNSFLIDLFIFFSFNKKYFLSIKIALFSFLV